MGLIDKLRAELIDIIEWIDDSKHTLVWRFPRYNNEIKNGAQLIVRPGQVAVFVHTALTLGNLNAIALEPMGHISGMATSVFSALATVGAVILTVPIGLMFNGTVLPLMIGSLVAVLLAFVLMRGIPNDDP